MSIIKAILRILKPERAVAKIDLAAFNPLGKDDETERTPSEGKEVEMLKAEIAQLVTQTEEQFYKHREKYLHDKITDETAKYILTNFPEVDFGENIKYLSLADQAFLTEEKYTMVIPILEKLKYIREYANKQKLSKQEFIELKRVLLKSLLTLFSSPSQIPTFDWTIEQLKEMKMIPPTFSFQEMERYCALGRWG